MRAFILAGGYGRRMGLDKARAPFFLPSGEVVPLAVATMQVFARAGCEVTLVRRAPADGLPWVSSDRKPLDVVWEPARDTRHPLWGVVEAMTAASDDDELLVSPCDLPFLTAISVKRLLAREGPRVAFDGERKHPLLGIYPVCWLKRVTDCAVAGSSVHHLVTEASVVELPASDLRNINSVNDLRSNWGQWPLANWPLGDESERQRVLDAEASRLWGRGVLMPA